MIAIAATALGFLGGPLKKYGLIIAGVLAVVGIVWFGWHRYTSAIEERDAGRIMITHLEEKNAAVLRGQAAVERILETTIARVRELQTIKQEVNEIPSTAVPADIRHVLERLRQRGTPDPTAGGSTALPAGADRPR